MSWGYRVIIIIAVFVIGVISMVFISMKQTNEIIDANYYEKELKYQSVIDGKNNLLELGKSVSIEKDSLYVTIVVPDLATTQLDSGTIEFIKLSSSKHDRSIIMKPENAGVYQIPKTWLAKGWYKIRVNWSNKGMPYYHEESFNAQ